MRTAARRIAAWSLALALAAPGVGLAAGRVHTVTLRDLAFAGMPAQIHAGDTVLWVNADILRHTATAKDRSFDVDLQPGARARTVFRRAGVVSFYCRYHPGMTGTIRVVAPGGSSGR